MRVCVSNGLLLRLTDYCRSKLPEEACGFMIGEQDGEKLRALDFIPVRNAAVDRIKHFAMDPAEMTAALFRIPQARLIGVFHSHPTAPSVPSAYDRQTAWHTLPTYWIISLERPGKPDFAIYNKKDFAAVREVYVNDD